MWTSLNDFFVCAVSVPAKSYMFKVRARKREYLQRFILGEEILTTKNSDYSDRAFVTKAAFNAMLAKRVGEISYDNFKITLEQLTKGPSDVEIVDYH